MRREGFRRGDADLGASVGEDGTGGFARDHGAHHVAYCEGGRALELGFALAGEGVGGFAGLADADGERFGVEDRISVAKLATVVDFDG